MKRPGIVNIVNFIRSTEPRYPDRDLLEPVANQIRLTNAARLPANGPRPRFTSSICWLSGRANPI